MKGGENKKNENMSVGLHKRKKKKINEVGLKICYLKNVIIEFVKQKHENQKTN